MESRPSGRKAYVSEISVPIEQISNRFGRIYVDGLPVHNHARPSLRSVNALHEVLRAYDKYYDPNIRTRSQLSRMPNLKQLLESNHVQESEYSFEIRKCEEEDCDICKNIGRVVRIPCVDAQRKALRFINLPIPNPMEKEHYISPSASREHIDRLKLY